MGQRLASPLGETLVCVCSVPLCSVAEWGWSLPLLRLIDDFTIEKKPNPNRTPQNPPPFPVSQCSSIGGNMTWFSGGKKA